MDFIFGILLAITCLCVILAAIAIRSAGEAKGQAASAHRLAVKLEGRDLVEVLEDGRVRFMAFRSGYVQETILGSKPQTAPSSLTPGNLVIKGGAITIESPATTQDLDDLYERIKGLQDKGFLRGS